jgi:Holliday junction resolvasome RuvABC endonuclease subunit
MIVKKGWVGNGLALLFLALRLIYRYRMRILGIDASSTTIGIAVIDCNDGYQFEKLIAFEYIKPPKKGNIFERLEKTQKMICDILTKYQPTHIAVEEIVQFMAGSSTAKTIISLATFNRMVGLTCYKYLCSPPEMLSVIKIRHKIKLSKVFPKKEEIPALLAKRLGIKLKPIYKKKKRELAIEFFDAADALAVATCYMMMLGDK